MSNQREIRYCANDRTIATQLVKKIVGAGDLGVIVQYGLCDECAKELVRSTRDRYVITPLPRGSRALHPAGEQQAWELDC